MPVSYVLWTALFVWVFVQGSDGDMEGYERSRRDEECLLSAIDRHTNQPSSSSVHDGLDVQHQTFHLCDWQLVAV